MNANRLFIVLNTVGVFALSALCVVQWRTNARLNLDEMARAKAQQEQTAQLAKSAQALQGCASDLESFREQITRTQASLKDSQTQLAEAEHQIRQLTAERDQFKAELEKWQAAVTARDQRLQEANTQIQKLAADRNEAVVKYNELAEKYNVVVESLNTAVARIKELTGATTPPNTETEKQKP